MTPTTAVTSLSKCETLGYNDRYGSVRVCGTTTLRIIHVLKTVDYDIRLLTTTSTRTKAFGMKMVLFVSGRVLLYVWFYIADVKKTPLGLQDLLHSGVLLNFRDSRTSTIQKGGVDESLLFRNKHFYLEALDIWLYYLQNNLFYQDNMLHYFTEDGGEEHAQNRETQQPRSTKIPQLPTEEERLQHEMTHQPLQAWCEICQCS